MSLELEPRIAELSARQHGVVTRGQLLEVGLRRSAIVRRLQSGRLRALHAGVYLTLPFPLARTRAMAAVLASGRGALLGHAGAAVLWGLCTETAQRADVDILAEGHHRRRPGIRVHQVDRLSGDERTKKEGIPVTTPARTLLDLAKSFDASQLEAAAARAQRQGLVSDREMALLMQRHAGEPGTPALRAVLGIPGGPALTRSAAELRLLALIREAGLPPPECNVRVGPYEVDVLWRAAGIAVEVDGFRYHGTRSQFEGDRRKDAFLLAAGISVLRLSWRQITERPVATAAQIAQALARADRR